MARYIDADALLKHYKAMANIVWNEKVAPSSWSKAYESFIEHIEELPTADVVECIHITEDMIKGHCDPVGERGEDGLLHIKQEVAREIFEEIDGITDLVAKGLIGELEFYDKIAELKKKYTESEE